MSERSVCVLDMALYKTLHILSYCAVLRNRLLDRMFVIAVCQCLNNKQILLLCINTRREWVKYPCFKCIDTVGWTAGRASGLGEWWRWALFSPD